MFRFRPLTAIFLSSMLFSCDISSDNKTKLNEGEILVKGTIRNLEPREITLDYVTNGGTFPVDTAHVDGNGDFVFRTRLPQEGIYRIVFNHNTQIPLILDTGDQVEVYADAENLKSDYDIRGTGESAFLSELSIHQSEYYKKMDSLRLAMESAQIMQDKSKYALIINDRINTIETYTNQLKAFIEEHPGTIASYICATQLSFETDEKHLLMVDSALGKEHPHFEFYAEFHERVATLRLGKVGTPAPDLTYADPDGNLRSLSELKGSYVLIDFWASWCKPCRMENPNVVSVYSDFKGKGFEIFGVSLDKDRQAWIKAIADDGITWMQVSDLKGWQSEAAAKYGVQSIPATFLIDPNGIIIDKDLRGSALRERLSTLLNS